MKFAEFRKYVELYKLLLEQGEKEEAKLILQKIDPNNLGIKRYFIVKKYRVEKVIEQLCEEKGFNLRYDMRNITNRGYDFAVNINNKIYMIKVKTKKRLGYIHLKSLYREPDFIDGINSLVRDYPEIIDGLWDATLKTDNEIKHRTIVSLKLDIMHKQDELDNGSKEESLILKMIKQRKEQIKEIEDGLDEIDVENFHTI